jgi:hypothetical protein
VPTSTVPRPTETTIPFVLRIAGLASRTIAPGQMQTVSVQSTPDTGIVVFRIMPNGAEKLLHLTTDASGVGRISFKQPGSAITRRSRVATIAVRVGSDPQDREVTATYTIRFGPIDLAIDRHSPAKPGNSAAIWVHSAAHTRVDLSVQGPRKRVRAMRATTGGKGWVEFRYTVPRSAQAGQSVSLTASARRSGKLFTAKSTLPVG